jgi:catechol 2,3-dioxygenase-like lactoylglutathione lyase family enzyme
MAGPIDETLRKFHLSLNVSNLERSIAFYRVLLGTEPAKVRPDYAKFELAEPALVLSLAPHTPGAGGNLNHLGLRVRTAEELVEIQRRLEAAGLPTEREEGVECCYARQTKFWISDPDRALWEIYVFHEDIAVHGMASAPVQARVTPLPVTAAAQVPRAWEHRLPDAIPDRVPCDDNSLHEARLEGSINAAVDRTSRLRLFSEMRRALRPGAAIYVHGLAGDRPTGLGLKLPGPAADIEYVPLPGDVVEELVEAGFADVQIEHLSPTAYFVVEGVPMRELRIVARKPGHRTAAATHHAVYLGPMKEVADDFGNVFRRGVATPLNVHDWQALSHGAAAGAFLLIAPEAPKTAACCDDATAPAAEPQATATA